MVTPQPDKHAIYRQARIGHPIGFGTRPAVVAVDLQIGFTDPTRSPLAGDLGAEIAAANRVISAARRAGAPVFFTVVGYASSTSPDAGLWPEKMPNLRLLLLDGELTELDPRIERAPGDVVLVKKYASAFTGTPLAAALTASGIDTLIIVGCTTSGCVRATVVDAIGAGFRPIVPAEAVGDRAREPHEANLFDMSSKYADVLPVDEVVAYLDGRRSEGG